MKKVLSVILLCSAVVVTGCIKERVKNSMTVVERSGSKPDWAEKRSWEKDSNLFFVGSVQGVKDLTLGEEQAEYQAKKTIASSIREGFQREFSTAIAGSNVAGSGSRLGQTLESALSASTDRVVVRGAIPVERYWEKLEIVVDDGVAYGYNITLLVRIPQSDYDRAKNDIVAELDRTDQIKADVAAKDLLDRVRGRLQSGGK